MRADEMRVQTVAAFARDVLLALRGRRSCWCGARMKRHTTHCAEARRLHRDAVRLSRTISLDTRPGRAVGLRVEDRRTCRRRK
jgi:hypothetical protein